MNKIISPLTSQMQGSKLGDVQATLQLFLKWGLILAGDEGHWSPKCSPPFVWRHTHAEIGTQRVEILEKGHETIAPEF